MQRTSLVVLAALCVVCSAHNIGDIWAGRRLLENDPDDEILIEGEQTVYQTAASTFGDLKSFPGSGWFVSNFSATLELDTTSTYADNFRAGDPDTWAAGTTRFNLTVNLTRGSVTTGNVFPPIVTAKLHTVSCDSSALMTSLLVNSPSGGTTASYNSGLGVTASNATQSVVNSTIFNYLVDYDESKSVVIYADQSILACKNLRPPFPDFPNDWSSTIEITDVERSSTFVMREAYSQSLGKVRLDLHAFGADRIIVNDVASNVVTAISPGNGSCTSRGSSRRNFFLTGDDNSTLLSTAELLHFTNPDTITYVPGFANIRGIVCEVWQAHVDITRGRFQSTFDVEFYFPINSWIVRREDYHRLLKRVHLNGTAFGEPFETYIEYVNFRPRTFSGPLFETCAISPYGANCNCTDALRRAAFSNLTATLASEGVDELSVGSAANAVCDYGRRIPHGFISAQSGPYVGLTIIGMIGGSLITGALMYFYYRKRVGVRITDNLRHTKFTDAPGT